MTTSYAAATGRFTTDGRPHGRTALTPYIVVAPAAEAIEFYAEVFGATVGSVTRFDDVVAHAELDFGTGWLTLSDPIADYGLIAPDPAAGAVYSLAVYVPQVDAVVERAVERGATLREPVQGFVSGDRYGSILDPYGVRWSVMTWVEDISDAESARRVAEWAQTQAGG
ncbi:VOC family protein [Melissospora conviva]|uniref:VOC family protein n=2 Tax=Melissospora conviva TaxID=3388432 RepID=UPI003B7879E9